MSNYKETAREMLFEDGSAKTEQDFEKWGRLMARLESLDEMGFAGDKARGGWFTYVYCRECGKRYMGKSYLRQLNHSKTHTHK